MKLTRSLFVAALSGIGLLSPAVFGQTYYYTPGEDGYSYNAPPVPTYSPVAAPTYTSDQLRQMVAPVALYPDPLLTQLLAAATYPQDIAAAQQWLQYFPNPTEEDIDAQPWDPSVKALVHYPSVLSMMAGQPSWTAALGAAFANQPQDVMNMVQQLRAEAEAANALQSTPQQQVVNDNGVIEIVPAQPNVIYVPQYDPNVVYVQRPYYSNGPLVTFGPSYGIGSWLDMDWDWHAHHVNEGVHWDRGWQHREDHHEREWRHNPERPIVVVPDRDHRNDRDYRGPGWNDDRNRRPVFDERQNPGRGEDHRAPERPVVGIPERSAPRPEEHRPVEVHPAPRPEERRPVEQARPAPRPAEQPRPVERPRSVEQPRPVEPPHVQQPPSGNFVGPPNSSYNRRPVEGIPRESAPVHAAPAPAPHIAPPPAPVHGAPGGPAFHSDGGGAGVQGGRGHESMHR